MVQEFQKKKKEEKNRVLESERKLFDARDDIIDLFEKKTQEEEESEQNKLEKVKDDYKIFVKYIEDESKDISYELLENLFYFSVPTVLVKELYETKDKNEDNELVNVIKSGIIDLKDEIKKMSKEEKENEKPDKILKIVEEILKFNKQKQLVLWLKILTPNQMLSRLPITLAQLKAGNNSEKVKNKIRQLLYSLYRSKKLTKQLYKRFIDVI